MSIDRGEWLAVPFDLAAHAYVKVRKCAGTGLGDSAADHDAVGIEAMKHDASLGQGLQIVAIDFDLLAEIV
jgi:hypothetical protein